MEDEEWPPGLDCYCHKQMALEFTCRLGRNKILSCIGLAFVLVVLF